MIVLKIILVRLQCLSPW